MAATRQKCLVAPLTMFRALRMQIDELEMVPDYKFDAPSALPDILSANRI
jgi:2-haloacid dehalogenase